MAVDKLQGEPEEKDMASNPSLAKSEQGYIWSKSGRRSLYTEHIRDWYC